MESSAEVSDKKHKDIQQGCLPRIIFGDEASSLIFDFAGPNHSYHSLVEAL